MSRILNVLLFLFIIQAKLEAQGSGVPLGNDSYHMIDRLDILSGAEMPIHTAIQAYRRGDITAYAIHLDTFSKTLSDLDRRDLYYIFRDNNEWLGQSEYATTATGKNEPAFTKKYIDSTQTFYTIETSQADASRQSKYYIVNEHPFLKHFYQTPANFFELNRKDFQLKLNPIINFKLAKANDDDHLLFENQRGIEIRGGVDDRIFFYSQILETQSRFPDYVNRRIQRDNAVPGAGLFKTYESSVFDIKDGYDYLNAQGYVGLNLTRHVGMQLGHGRNFIGHGYRSLLLSDFSNNYFYLKFNTRVWKLHYQNIFAELTIGDKVDLGDQLKPKKYMAAHYLSFKPSAKMELGIFETVVFSRNNNFELQYLNPIILYRTVEGYIGSPDNVLIGVNGKWNLFKRIQLYGQLMLDEFKFEELLLERRGWWGNKYGVQLGLKSINTFGVDHLDTQFEFNTVRPYTYTHRDSSASYAHYNQPLAHPLGANFKEYIFKLRYQPVEKITFDARLMYFDYGEGTDSLNWGNNILKPHTTRVMEFGNEIGQGIHAETVLFGLDISYQLYHNMYVDLHYFYRNQDSEAETRSLKTHYFGGGFRMNIANRRNDF